MNNLTSLPEKWCILVNENNQELLRQFYVNHLSHYLECRENWIPGLHGYFHYPQLISGCHTHNSLPKDYTKITFEQFQKWVLKEHHTNDLFIKLL